MQQETVVVASRRATRSSRKLLNCASPRPYLELVVFAHAHGVDALSQVYDVDIYEILRSGTF